MTAPTVLGQDHASSAAKDCHWMLRPIGGM